MLRRKPRGVSAEITTTVMTRHLGVNWMWAMCPHLILTMKVTIEDVIEAKLQFEMWKERGYFILPDGRLPLVAEGYYISQ